MNLMNFSCFYTIKEQYSPVNDFRAFKIISQWTWKGSYFIIRQVLSFFVEAFLSESSSDFWMHFIECHKSLGVLNSLNDVSKFTASNFD